MLPFFLSLFAFRPFIHLSLFSLYSATQEDDMGQLYLSNVDFLKNGVPASIIATLVRLCLLSGIFLVSFFSFLCLIVLNVYLS